MAKILMVDDDRNILTTMGIALKREDHEVDLAASYAEAVNFMESAVYDIVITDLRMGEKGGIDVLRSCKETSPDTEVIVLTAYGSLQTAIEALREGASDYILKPCGSDQMTHNINRVLEKKKLVSQIKSLKKQVANITLSDSIVGKSQVIQQLKKKIALVADTDATVLVTGETGTGKEVVANSIHARSRRNDSPLLAISCAALPENLLESELFGHVKGAFSGAISNKKGLVVEAHKGTLFLDEIGEMTVSLQSKLLRFIEEGEVRPVGSNKTRIVDVRLLAASNKNLVEAVEVNDFRKDLYYRLKVVNINIPPLRARGNDVILLATHFIQHFAQKGGKPKLELSKEARAALKSYDWPGNVRELKHIIEGAVILSGETVIMPEHLDLDIPSPPSHEKKRADPQNITISEVTRQHLLEVLEKYHWNQKKASQVLGISKATLWRRLKAYDIDVKSIRKSMYM
jgi:DNA-binding NtrC family response regulator